MPLLLCIVRITSRAAALPLPIRREQAGKTNFALVRYYSRSPLFQEFTSTINREQSRTIGANRGTKESGERRFYSRRKHIPRTSMIARIYRLLFMFPSFQKLFSRISAGIRRENPTKQKSALNI